MTPEQFIQKWRENTRSESQASQQHFLELCELLEVEKPGEPGTNQDDYTFEKNVLKLGDTTGRADVWRRGCFAWEYKGDKKSLVGAYAQVKGYADALDNPPLLIVSDMREIQIHTNFTNEVKETHIFQLADLNDPSVRQKLRWAFTDPERLLPEQTTETVTEDAAATIGALATKLRSQDYEPRRVAHFLNKLVFCMYAEDIELLPGYVFTEILEQCVKQSDLFERMVGQLFAAMRDKNGLFGTTVIPWFNGGLFSDDDVLPLGYLEIRDLNAAAQLDWSAIEPSIFGTLFERGLDPAKRKEMASLFDARGDSIETSASRDLFADVGGKAVGVHYTDPETIMKIVEPVVLRPLRAEWEEVKAKVTELRKKRDNAKLDATKTRHENAARDAYLDFRKRLADYRVLDPACGSGNFLYLALRHLKDFDLAVKTEAEARGLPLDDQRITPEAVKGIEINEYAAELAQVTIWIGEIQWQLENGFGITRSPILGNLASISCHDALINPDGSEATWPEADAIIGNPPFLGSRRMQPELGSEYVQKVRAAYRGRVSRGADFVCFWFSKAWDALVNGLAQQVGLVATNSISGGASRKVLIPIAENKMLANVWRDEPWVVDGAAVRVSLICFGPHTSDSSEPAYLDGREVIEIGADLRAPIGSAQLNLGEAKRLNENQAVSFQGVVPRSSVKKSKARELGLPEATFVLPGDVAREMLTLPLNPNGCSNSDVVVPYLVGDDITSGPKDRFIVDFGDFDESEAALYEAPFKYIQPVKLHRANMAQPDALKYWWQHWRSRPDMRAAINSLPRFMVTPRVAKHRLFAWSSHPTLPDNAIVVISRDDDTTFGILHSQFHELWALRQGTSLEDRPRYTPSTTFEKFPFPEGLTPNTPATDYADDSRAQRIAEAAQTLNELRENWLNPLDLVRREPEVVEGYPDRILPVNDRAAKELKKRTLTNLYNERPAWLDNAHRALDEAVAAAYGWPADLSDDDILAHLLELNLERAEQQETAD